MRAGRLRHRGVLQQVTETRDAHGGVTETWTERARPWVSIKPLHGREAMYANQVDSNITHEIRMRYDSGITPAMRLSCRGRTFEFLSVANIDERDRELAIMAKEVV